MRRLGPSRHISRPSILGLIAGSALSVFGILASASAIAQPEPIAPHPVLEASHLPPLLTVPDEVTELTFDVHCAPEGIDDPERACDTTGSLFVRPGSSGDFQEIPLREETSSGLRRLTALVPDRAAKSRDGLEYYAVIEADNGGQLRVPSGPAATYHSYFVPDAVEVDLSPSRSVSTRRGSRVVFAHWGDGVGDAGLEAGRSAAPIGASSFDVAPDGTVALLDEAHRRVLRWAPAARQPAQVPLAISGLLADVTLADDGSMYVLETDAAPGRTPLIRSFDPTGGELDVAESAEASPSQIRIGPDGPVVLEHPSHMWMPISSGGKPLPPGEQKRRGSVGRPIRPGAEVITYRTGNELRLALVSRGHVERSWRLVSSTPLAEVQLAEPLGSRLVVVLRIYDGDSDEFRVVVLDRRSIVQEFSVDLVDWAETAPLSRFRLVGHSLYQLGSNPTGAFVDRHDLEVDP